MSPRAQCQLSIGGQEHKFGSTGVFQCGGHYNKAEIRPKLQT